MKALHLMTGTKTSLNELCDMIRPDAAFSTEVLGMANSPLVAMSRTISDVQHASMLLGFQRLRNIVITVGVRTYLSETFTPLLQSCWRHSLACAMIAERAAKACNLDKDFAYTAGIMHDIGRVALAVSMPDAYRRVIEAGADQSQDLLKMEIALCGIDHCQAGGILFRQWGFPVALYEVAIHHHEPDPNETGLAAILSQSCLLADVLGFGVAEYRNPPDYSSVVGNFPEAARSRLPVQRDLATEITNEIKLIEST